MKTFKNKGFTLIEMLVYIAVLSVIVAAVSSFIVWTIRSNTKAKVLQEVLNNSRRAIEVISAEIKEAQIVYFPTSDFDSHPGQLSLKTLKNLPSGEQETFIDFYLCGDHLCVKKESQSPLALTSNKVRVTNLVFRQIDNDPVSLEIDLEVEFADTSGRPENQAVIATTSFASIRSY